MKWKSVAAVGLAGLLGVGLAVLPATGASADESGVGDIPVSPVSVFRPVTLTASINLLGGSEALAIIEARSSQITGDDLVNTSLLPDPEDLVVGVVGDSTMELITDDLVDVGTAGGSTDSTVQGVVLAENPANCVQKANYPHVSSYETDANGKPIVKGEVRATCAWRIEYLYQTAQLWEERWWGWDRVGTKGVYDRYNPPLSVQTFGRSGCKNNKFRTTGYGLAKIAGDWYEASANSGGRNLSSACPG